MKYKYKNTIVETAGPISSALFVPVEEEKPKAPEQQAPEQQEPEEKEPEQQAPEQQAEEWPEDGTTTKPKGRKKKEA